MKFNKRIITLFLAILMMLASFTACTTTTDPQVTEKPGESIIDTPSESLTDIETEPTSPTVTVFENNELKYAIITNERSDFGSRDAAFNLLDEIYRQTGKILRPTSDKTEDGKTPPEKAMEVLIGDTNRSESVEAMKNLRNDDFIVRYDENSGRIIIAGGSKEATAKAVEYFIKTCFNTKDKTIIVDKKLNYSHKFTYPVGNVSINNVPLSSYKIVYPKNADLFTYYAGVNLKQWLEKRAGVTLELVDDSKPETANELLVGKTNRKASLNAATTKIADGDFLLKADGTKIVMLGNTYLVGGAVSEFVNEYLLGVSGGKDVDITTIPKDNKTKTFKFKKAKSGILLIGDGMGFNHIEMALKDKIDHFYARDLPLSGKCTTFSESVKNGQAGYTDSAAAATALSTGIKTINGYIGKNKIGKDLLNIRELAQSRGAKTAVLTTDVITGATPAGFLAHDLSRKNTAALQKQIDALIKNGKIDYCKGSLGDNLAKEAGTALNIVSAGDEPFFVMLEEGYIDKRSHSNDADGVKDTVARYNTTIAYVTQFVMLHPDTVLLITADHETGGIITDARGNYVFTKDVHTNQPVPIFGLGDGAEFINGKTIDNTDIPKFFAEKLFGVTNFGK